MRNNFTARFATYSTKEKGKHLIIRKLKKLGYDSIEVTYASMSSSDAGWTVTDCFCISKCEACINGEFLGLTLEESYNRIKNINPKKP